MLTQEELQKLQPGDSLYLLVDPSKYDGLDYIALVIYIDSNNELYGQAIGYKDSYNIKCFRHRLNRDYCEYCDMIWYNCLCCHLDDDEGC